jgi:hypothetical protein
VTETFTLNFLYNGIPQEVSCSLRTSAYTYQFLCSIQETEIILEKDDEGNLRAREVDPFSNKSKKPEPGFIRALIDEMERILQ